MKALITRLEFRPHDDYSTVVAVMEFRSEAGKAMQALRLGDVVEVTPREAKP